MKNLNPAQAIIILSLLFFVIGNIAAQNPFITNQCTADLTARVFNGKV